MLGELLSSNVGSEIYRMPVPAGFAGRPFREFAHAMVDRECAVVGIARGSEIIVNPPRETELRADDAAFVVAQDPPEWRD